MGRKNRNARPIAYPPKQTTTNNIDDLLRENTKKMILSSIEWGGGRRRRHQPRNLSDVSIVIRKRSDNKDNLLTIYFRNSTYTKIPERINYGICKNRMYFAYFDKGYKITNMGTGDHIKGCKMAIKNESEERKLRPFEGNYDLKFDDFTELYYIEREELDK